jgi:hypothetical protein
MLSITAAFMRTAPGRSFTFTLLVYAAVIATFVGAVHWGLALRTSGPREVNNIQLLWSICPAVAAWLIVVALDRAQALAAMAILMALCLGVDWLLRIKDKDAIPRWYFLMRCVLVPVVSFALLVAAKHA